MRCDTILSIKEQLERRLAALLENLRLGASETFVVVDGEESSRDASVGYCERF